MGQPWGAQPHTVAQFARRAKISEGRARALYTAHGLRRPNGCDADGRPLWWASTIDAWCASTGRTVADESLWIFRVPPASTPVVELQRGVIKVNRHGRPHPMYAIVWDTEHGHVISRPYPLQAPPSIVAGMLGYHSVHAEAIAAQAGGTWKTYAPGDHTQ